MVNFFRKEKHLIYLTHGAMEHGADVLMFLDPKEDFLKCGQLMFHSNKKGNITLAEWHKNYVVN